MLYETYHFDPVFTFVEYKIHTVMVDHLHLVPEFVVVKHEVLLVLAEDKGVFSGTVSARFDEVLIDIGQVGWEFGHFVFLYVEQLLFA